MHADTEGVATDMLTPPWLRRSMPTTRIPQESGLVVNKLQVKICLNTYKLFYLVNTEDTLVRHPGTRAVDTRKLQHNRTIRAANGHKWTWDGYLTKKEQTEAAAAAVVAAAAAAAAAEAKELAPHPSTTSAAVTQPTSSPPASSATPAPQSEIQRSTDPTPIPPAVVPEEPPPTSDVKIESPHAAEIDDEMDVEPVDPTSIVREPRLDELKVMDEDVEMQDA